MSPITFFFSKVNSNVCTFNCNSAEKSLWTGIRNLEKEKQMRKIAQMDHSSYMERQLSSNRINQS